MIEAIREYIQYQLTTNGLDILKKVGLAVMSFVIIYFLLVRVVGNIKKKIVQNDIEYNKEQINKIAGLIWTFLFVLFMLFNVLISLEILGVDTALLMWWLSIWLAFSLENVIWNMISGIMILTNQKLKIWDTLVFEGTLDLFATIENINIRYTVLRTIDRRRVLIPNTVMLETPFRTLKRNKLVRANIDLTLPRWVSVKQVRTLIKDHIKTKEKIVNPELASVVISWFTARGIDLKVFFYVDPKVSSAWFFVKTELREEIDEILKKYWITMPVSHVNLDFEE